jgi:hypothetical protein
MTIALGRRELPDRRELLGHRGGADRRDLLPRRDFADRVRIDPIVALRTAGGIVLGIVSTVIGHPYGLPADLVLLLLALVLVPLGLLPIVVVVLLRRHQLVAGPLALSDLAAIVYLIRVAAGRRVLGMRLTASRIALALWLLWTVLVTLTGLGQVPTIGWLAVYAGLGCLLTHAPDAKRWLHLAVLGLALTEIVAYLPSFPARFFGHIVNDPAHMGFLLVCALVLVAGSAWPKWVRGALAAALLFGVLCTYTRSVWFSLACVVVAALLPKRWYVPLVLPPLLAAIMLPLQSAVTAAFHLNTNSASIRAAGFEAGLDTFRNHPLTGQGWAAASAARARGIGGISQVPVFDLWLYLAGAVGLIGVVLFLVYTGLLAREALTEPVSYLCLVGALGMSLTEMPFYSGSLIAVLMLTMTTSRPRDPSHRAAAHRAAPGTGPHFARHHRRAPYYLRSGARA